MKGNEDALYSLPHYVIMKLKTRTNLVSLSFCIMVHSDMELLNRCFRDPRARVTVCIEFYMWFMCLCWFPLGSGDLNVNVCLHGLLWWSYPGCLLAWSPVLPGKALGSIGVLFSPHKVKHLNKSHHCTVIYQKLRTWLVWQFYNNLCTKFPFYSFFGLNHTLSLDSVDL